MQKRKTDHLRICLEKDVEVGSAGFEDVALVHNALPEVDLSKIDISTRFLNKKLKAPILIEAMTGGTTEAKAINGKLAQVAEEMGLGIEVGSQRAAIEDAGVSSTFSVVSKKAPNALKIANLGAVQLNYGYGVGECKKAVDMVNADALALHLNPLQETIQPEGNTNFSDLLERVEEVCSSLGKPVIVKEVGCGLSKCVGEKLVTAGVSCLDVGGFGGTSWTLIEGIRQGGKNSRIAESFRYWGIPTAISLLELKDLDVLKIASGGIRDGAAAAKSIVLG
ncbi:MAG: type 2 isopentenyl-diphosphate Delta-isomerase, partial [Candidatus Altiarchaeota archaeon]|nr:type 2 isopentenyl-diphosphate Delta-isomerase [Candidatus Altiarchaeota archaeon]